VSHDARFCKNYVFADLQRSPLLFPVVENVLAQLYMQLVARREFKHWSVFLPLKTFHRLETDSARNNIHPNNKQEPEIQKKKHRKTNIINTARLLRISFLETLHFLAPEGITNFGTALAEHCNHVFCSFVLQID